MRQFLPIGFFLCLLLLLPACAQVSSVAEGLGRHLPDWVPGVESKKVKKIKKPKKKTATVSAESDNATSPEPIADPVEAVTEEPLVGQPEVGAPPVETPPTNIVFKPSMKFSATQVTQAGPKITSPKIIDETLPFKISSHWGGPAEVLADISPKTDFDFVGQGRHVTVYQASTLSPLGSIDGAVAVEKIISFANKGRQVVYLKELGNQLEIFDLDSQGHPSRRGNFGMENNFDGPFEFPSREGEDSHQIFVRHADKIQCLEVNRKESEIIGDYPLAQSLQVLPKKDRLYILHSGGLNIMDRDTKQNLASLSLVGEVKLLGLVDLGGKYTLVSLLKNPEAKYWEYFLPIELSWDGRSVQKVEDPIALPPNVDQVSLDELKPRLFLGKGQHIQIFDLLTRQALPEVPVGGSPAGGGPIVALRVLDQGLRVLLEAKLSTYALKDTAPLSETGSASLLTSVDQFILLPNKALLFFSDKTLAYSNGAKMTFKALPETLPINLSALAVSGQGVFFLESRRAKIYYASFDLSLVNELDLAEKITSLASLSRAGKTFLFTTSAKGLATYEVTNFKTTKKLGSHPATDFSDLALSQDGTKIFVACGARGLCVLDNQDQTKFKESAMLKPAKAGARAEAILLSPDQQTVYLYNTLAQGNYVSLIDIKKPKPTELSQIQAKDLTAQQFKGATFSRGGQVLILPDAQGLAFHDNKKPTKPAMLFHPNLGPVSFTDVTNQGKTICAALGDGGLDCGEW